MRPLRHRRDDKESPMVDEVAAPAVPELELPKPARALKSSSAEAEPLRYTEASGSFYEHDEVAMRLTSKDGDVLEVRGSFTYASAYSMKTWARPAALDCLPGGR